ncbi:MAG: thioredoxin family protein [Desulfomonilia bacterium]|jgi:thioredoxin 1
MSGSESLQEITESGLDSFIGQPLAVLLFTSPWCSACKKMYPALLSLSEKLKQRASFGIMDISKSPSASLRMQVFSVPTVIVFRAGREVKRLQGPATEAAISGALEEAL